MIFITMEHALSFFLINLQCEMLYIFEELKLG